MGLLSIIGAGALAAQPVAQAAPAPRVAQASAQEAETAAVRAVLWEYKSAIERLDATGTEKLFTADATVFETGGAEGSYSQYLGHHLGPELKAFNSFKFSDYKVDVRFEGPVALATETYKYRIETKKSEVVERQGVATSVLMKVGGQWKILSTHSSGRTPKAPKVSS